jgi:hypothetical protein
LTAGFSHFSYFGQNGPRKHVPTDTKPAQRFYFCLRLFERSWRDEPTSPSRNRDQPPNGHGETLGRARTPPRALGRRCTGRDDDVPPLARKAPWLRDPAG